jgi:hypothetical protein
MKKSMKKSKKIGGKNNSTKKRDDLLCQSFKDDDANGSLDRTVGVQDGLKSTKKNVNKKSKFVPTS